METEYQHDRLLFTLVVDTITVIETVKAKTPMCVQKRICDRSRVDLVIRKKRISRNHTLHQSVIEKNDSAAHAYFQLKFRDKFIENYVEKHNVEDIAKDEWNMHALCERNFCLTLALTQPFLSMNVVNIAPNSRDESEAWRKLELSNLKAWTKKQSDTGVHLAHMNRSPQAWTAYASSTTVILFTCRVPCQK